MQTKQQIQRLLASAGVSPNKRLGQHFLIDLNLMRLLISSANIQSSDTVLEVGCGTGSLTEGLSRYAGKVIAVEADPALAEIAREQLATTDNIEIISADILKNKTTLSRTVLRAIRCARKKAPGRFLLVSNLPYNVASPVMLNLVTGPAIADGMYVTVQKQVAERMTAEAGSSAYGTLTIFLKATGDVKTTRVLKPMVFWPQPRVDSAMVSYVHQRKKRERIRSYRAFQEVVNLFIGHRRKMLKTCTKFAQGKLGEIHDWRSVFAHSSVDPARRPEQLTPEDYVALANASLCGFGRSQGRLSGPA
jgi:16S rRNA (adenine1518-N6/adenine1519-N6)-dimethyltransferase